MKYKYKIIYDLQYDMWNWRDALKNSFMNYNWIDNISNKSDLKIAKQILSLKKTESQKILKEYLQNQKNNPKSKLNKFIKIIEKNFQEKYQDACKILEKITNRPLMSDNFTIYVTTFPRCLYFYEKKGIFIYDATEDFWGMPIDTFLHEAHHFQFIHYWYKNKKSPVSKLEYKDFDYLKEALTVVLNDDELKSIISLPDVGYPNQKKYRKILYKYWQKYHNFDKLVDFGLSKLIDFVK